MDRSISHHHHKALPLSQPPGKSLPPRNFAALSFCGWRGKVSDGFSLQSRSAVVVAAAGASRCEPGSSLNAPLEPRSDQGRFLSSVLLNQKQFFLFAASDELKQLADDRDAALARVALSSGSDEEFLHRRIARLKEISCQQAVEDIMYMMIFYKFSEIRVLLVPKLSRCVYNGRLEIWPSKDWELESIHCCEVLKLIKERVSAVTGLRLNASVTENWATMQIQKLRLSRVYTASVLYGYFLKSVSTRHKLEQSLSVGPHDLRLSRTLPRRLKNLIFGGNPISISTSGHESAKQELTCEKLRAYITGFDPETLQRCAKLKSREAVNLVEKQSRALFGAEKTGSVDDDEIIVTSFSSLKRLVLEAVAFGSFLWDTEEFVDGVYKLEENRGDGGSL